MLHRFAILPSTGDDSIELLKGASESVTRDKGFKLPSVPASAALSTASKLTEWMSKRENEAAVIEFSEKLVESLKGCLFHITGSHKSKRERMWRKFHTLRISGPFKDLWQNFLRLASVDISPMLYQRISDIVLEELLTRQFSVEQVEEPTISALTYEER